MDPYPLSQDMDVPTPHFPDDGETTTEISIRHKENTPMSTGFEEAEHTPEDIVGDMGGQSNVSLGNNLRALNT